MQQDPRVILQKYLEIAGYEDDKEAFIDEFIQNCEKQTILDLIATFPPERQAEIKQKANEIKEAETIKALIRAHITPEEYTEGLKKVSKNAFTELIETVLPAISDKQKKDLQTFLDTYKH